MTSYFDITPANADPVTLGKDGKARYSFTVTSRAEMTVRAIVQAVPLTNQDMPPGSAEALSPLDPKWLKIDDEAAKGPAPAPAPPASGTPAGAPAPGGAPAPAAAARPKAWEFRPKETRQIAVRVEAPGAKHGNYRFKLVVALEEDPGAHSSSSSSVCFKVPQVEVRPFPWIWIVVSAAALLLIGGIVTTILVINGGGEVEANGKVVAVPKVVDMDYVAAAVALGRAGLNPVRAKVTILPDKPEGVVIDQLPKAGEEVAVDSRVDLEVSGKAVTVPNVVDRLVAQAQELLVDKDLTFKVTGEDVTGKVKGTILSQDPAAGQKVAPGTIVQIVIEGDGVEVPKLVGLTATNALVTLQARHLDLGTTSKKADATQAMDTVADQNPKPGQKVKSGSKVDLTIWSQPGRIIKWDDRLLRERAIPTPKILPAERLVTPLRKVQ